MLNSSMSQLMQDNEQPVQISFRRKDCNYLCGVVTHSTQPTWKMQKGLDCSMYEFDEWGNSYWPEVDDETVIIHESNLLKDGFEYKGNLKPKLYLDAEDNSASVEWYTPGEYWQHTAFENSNQAVRFVQYLEAENVA